MSEFKTKNSVQQTELTNYLTGAVQIALDNSSTSSADYIQEMQAHDKKYATLLEDLRINNNSLATAEFISSAMKKAFLEKSEPKSFARFQEYALYHSPFKAWFKEVQKNELARIRGKGLQNSPTQPGGIDGAVQRAIDPTKTVFGYGPFGTIFTDAALFNQILIRGANNIVNFPGLTKRKS